MPDTERNDAFNGIRKISNNIRILMYLHHMDVDEFARKTGYTIKESYRILEGNIILPPASLTKIASLFRMTSKQLIEYESDQKVPDINYSQTQKKEKTEEKDNEDTDIEK
jgi:transcriptional regulator with XRE-family HTH domain